MVKLLFYQRTDREYNDGSSPIFMQLSYNGNRIRKPVPEVVVKPQNWSTEKKRVKKGDPHFEEFNSRLDEIQSKVIELNKVVLMNKVQLNDKFILDRITNPNQLSADRKQFRAIFEEYLNAIRPNSEKGTIKGKTSPFNFIKNFEDERKKTLYLHSFNTTFFEEFRQYAFEEKQIEANYFAKIIATLKTFLNWAFEKGLTDNLDYKKFKAPEKEKEVIYLTKEELTSLYNYQFNSDKLSHVRDIFCFSCFTGLRFSDVISLKPAHIIDKQIVKTIIKTKVSASIPLNKYALDILKKYADGPRRPLPRISKSRFNENLRTCCEKAGINTPTLTVQFKGGKRTESVDPKYKLISSHLGRKTFITLSLIHGMKEIVVRDISGHKKEKSFKRYVKIADTTKRVEMDLTWDSINL